MARLPRNLVRRGNRYVLRVMVDGRIIRRALGSDITEARRRAAAILRSIRGGTFHENQTRVDGGIAGVVTRFLTEVAPLTQCAKAQKSTRNRLDRFFLPMVSGVALEGLRPEHLRAVRRFTESHGLATSTVADVMSAVRTFLNWCQRDGLISKTPWVRGLIPRIQERAPDRLTDEQVTKILASAQGEDHFAIEFSLLTGLRRSELVNLHRRHIHRKPRPHLLIEQTKSGRVRRIPLVPRAEEILKTQTESHDSLCVLQRRVNNAQGTVFRVDAGFPWHWHQLRHTFACRYLEAGGRLSALQQIMGHATSRMTERYAALSDDAVFDDAARIHAGLTQKVVTQVVTSAEEPDSLSM